MSARQARKMFQLMAGGEPVELTNAWGSVKKLARLAFVAQQFGYEYADARRTGSRNNVLKLLIVPDNSPQGRARAAQNWAQYPNAADGVSLPPLVPDAVELLRARIQFDLTGKNAEKRMAVSAGAITLGLVFAAVRNGGGTGPVVIAGVVWVIAMAVMGLGFFVTRGRNAKFAQRLQAAGFVPVTDQSGRVRYLPPGTPMPMQQGSMQQGPMQQGPMQQGPMQHPQYQPPQPHPQPQYQPGPYGPYSPYGGQSGHGPYGGQPPAAPATPTPAGYGQQPPPPHTPGPYAQPAGPYAPPQQPPGPYAPGPYHQQPPQPPYPSR
ncbi:hypothetical protein [Streptomyces shenzhenensis]|uniref:hypothetical protein n=1 Tax=Streptomyces shenzhenensis TaxID=943815 RepID=UPI001F17A306|nr:hypothetical protein [Streptomyces shenzhenensis]